MKYKCNVLLHSLSVIFFCESLERYQVKSWSNVLTDWLNDLLYWLTSSLTDLLYWLTDWLTDWMNDPQNWNDLITDWPTILTDCLTGCLADWLQLTDWLTDWMTYYTDWLTDWLQLTNWLTDYMYRYPTNERCILVDWLTAMSTCFKLQISLLACKESNQLFSHVALYMCLN